MSHLDALGRQQWQGQAGRLEVWYATFTDAATGLGGWIHIETVAPKDGGAAHTHGWTAVFAPSGDPVVERFGPVPAAQPAGAWVELVDLAHEAGPSIGPGTSDGVRLAGQTDRLAWDLEIQDGGEPLYTFSRAVWQRHLLPAAQIVPVPTGTVSGSLTVDGASVAVEGHGALARIYGHGNAQRWGWLHADLGEGGALEIVTAVARRRSMRWLPPLAMVQLRLPGEADWPRNPVVGAPRFRTTLRGDGFDVRGRVGGRRLEVSVDLPDGGSVALGYTDPDGAPATCTNSERATARITLSGKGAERTWTLDATAHAEVGTRP